jgi:MurNAc alpha-1-phosphate uridylyltransferase
MADSLAGTGGAEDAAPDRPAPTGELVGVVLAAGAGRRLRPLTSLLPKPLCPVGNEALLDRALVQVGAVTDAVAVNLHHGGDAIDAHLGSLAVYRSVEQPEALGTAGALGRLRPWIDGRGALVVNADGWSDADLGEFVTGWDGVRVRMLIAPPRGEGDDDRGGDRFGPGMGVVASLLPWAEIARLTPVPSGLYEVSWRIAHVEGRLDVVAHRGSFVDCGTPADYLRANLLAVDLVPGSGGAPSIVGDGARVVGRVERSVVGAGALVEGSVVESVVWPGSRVEAGEHLVRAVRAGRLTVEVR